MNLGQGNNLLKNPLSQVSEWALNKMLVNTKECMYVYKKEWLRTLIIGNNHLPNESSNFKSAISY